MLSFRCFMVSQLLALFKWSPLRLPRTHSYTMFIVECPFLLQVTLGLPIYCWVSIVGTVFYFYYQSTNPHQFMSYEHLSTNIAASNPTYQLVINYFYCQSSSLSPFFVKFFVQKMAAFNGSRLRNQAIAAWYQRQTMLQSEELGEPKVRCSLASIACLFQEGWAWLFFPHFSGI